MPPGRRDQNNPIRSTGTVNSGGRGIFKDIDTFNVIGVYIANGTRKGNAIQDNKRIIAGGQGSGTADANLHTRPGFARGLVKLHPR